MKALKVIAFLSIIAGALIYILGVVSKIQHWPDLLRGRTSGQILVFLGVVLYLIYIFTGQKKEK